MRPPDPALIEASASPHPNLRLHKGHYVPAKEDAR